MTATDSTYLALLRAVLIAPADDLPRLVLADWLEGDADPPQPERAEFVRVQCELAGLPGGGEGIALCRACDGNGYAEPPPYHRRCRPCKGTGKADHAAYNRAVALSRRQRELLAVHNRKWFYPLREYVTLYDVTRGFVSAVTCPADVWLVHADALYWHPEQTVKCPRKVNPKLGLRPGLDRLEYAPPPHPADCVCKGTGRVPREMPATAQPLERVTLTTWPEGSATAAARQREWKTSPHRFLGRNILDLWRAEWPGIKFETPDQSRGAGP